MIKLLLLVLLGFVLYSFLQSLFRPRVKPSEKKPQIHGEVMVEDPVCGTCLPERDAVKWRAKGQDHYFCSQQCLDKFRQSTDNNSSPS